MVKLLCACNKQCLNVHDMRDALGSWNHGFVPPVLMLHVIHGHDA